MPTVPVELLFQVSSVFPFDLFPTTVTVEKDKVNFVDQIFFASQQVQSIFIRDILTVEVETSLLFASLKIFVKMSTQKPVAVKYLPAKAALKAQKIIQGLMAMNTQTKNSEPLPPSILVERAEKIGAPKVIY